MNATRRKELKKALALCDEAKVKLEEAEEIVQACHDEEEECYDNLPESLQDGEKGERMQEVISELEDFIDNRDSVTDDIDLLMEHIENAAE